jgi:hypothetical protein
VSSAAFVRAARVEARQDGTVLWSRRVNLVPARPFSMRDTWLGRIDPARGAVTIAVDA